MSKVRSDKTEITFGRRLASGCVAAAMGISCVATNVLGIVDFVSLQETVHAANEETTEHEAYQAELRSSALGDYVVGETYYDIGTLYGHAYWNKTSGEWTDVGNGTYQETGWHVYNVKSFLDADGDGYNKNKDTVNTLPYTTDLNDSTKANITRDKELMCWQVYASQDAYRNQYLERTDIPDFSIPTFDGDATPAYYIAKGTVEMEGDEQVITWDIRSWVTDNGTWIDPDTFSKTGLTGLSEAISTVDIDGSTLEGYFSAFDENTAGSELENMWNKADFESEASISEPFTFGDSVDTWWKGVAANIYKADVSITGTSTYTDDTRITNVKYHVGNSTDILGNVHDSAIDAELTRNHKSDTDSRYNLGNAVAALNPVNALIKSGSDDPASISADFKSVTADKGHTLTNTFDGSATYATFINPSAIEVDIAKSVLIYNENSIANTLFPDCGVTITSTTADGKTVSTDHLPFEYQSHNNVMTVIATGKVLQAIDADPLSNGEFSYAEGSVSADKRYALSNDDLNKLSVYLVKKYMTSKSSEYTYMLNGKEQVGIADQWFFDNGADYFAKRLGVSDEVAAAVNRNVTDAAKDISGEAHDEIITLTFPNLSYLDTDYNRTTGHAVYPIVGLMGNIVNLGSAVRANLTSYYSTGYQRAAGAVKAKRVSGDTLNTFANTDDANNNTPKIGVASDAAKIVDRIDYANLTAGTEYKIVGALYDVETGCAIKADGTISKSTDVITFDADTTYAIASSVFTPDASAGSMELEFTYDASKLAGHKIVVLDKLYVNATGNMLADHNDKADADQTIEIAVPDMGTKATGADNESKSVDVAEQVTIRDLVTYEGLVPGKEYTLVAQPMDKATNKAIGKSFEKSFVPESANGSVTIDVTVDTSEMAGKSIVMFETVKYNNVDIIVHNDLNDADQTVTVKQPTINTFATAEDGTSKFIDVLADAIILDKVSYENLVPGEKYTLKAELYDENDTKVVIDETAVEFVAESANGSADVNIKFDTRGCAGKSFTVVEYLIYGKAEIARHYDLTSEDQTVTVKSPEIKTAASAPDDATIKSVDCGSEAGILDRVSYTNLKDGKTYTLVASVFDKKTGAWVENVASQEFVADSKVGYVDVNITFDTTDKKGNDLVIGETLYVDGVAILEHKDVDDVDQTVTVKAPAIGTVAAGIDGSHDVDCTDDLTINDTVEFRNLTVGKTYTLTAGLYDATAEEWVGKNVGTKTFKAEAESGSVVVEIKGINTLNRTGHKLVVVETLKTGETVIAEHNDLEDTNQTVTVKTPGIETMAFASADSDSKLIDCYDKVSFVDIVRYENLVPGKEYTLTASIWDATDNKSLGTAVGSNTFTPTAANGSVEVKIENIDTHALATHKIVVFETLKYGETDIAKHEDKTDKDQTVTVKQPKIATKAYGKDGSKKIDCLDKVTIYDDVMYEDLSVGQSYTLIAGLYDVNKGEYITEEVTHTFVPATANGTETVEIANVDTTALMGDSLVVVEKLVSNKITYVNHDDLTDADQTVTVKGPGIKTVAMNAAKDGKTIDVASKSVIVDTVTLTDLSVGTEYEINVGLYDLDTKEYIDGIAVDDSNNAVVTFVADSEDMEMDVSITVDTIERMGHKLVVVETLSSNGKTIAEHTSTSDENQTVTVKTPTIRTHAFDKSEKETVIDCGKDVTIVDVVDYTGLAVGKTYTLEAGLRDAATGKLINGQAGSLTFKPTSPDGSVKVVIEHVDTTKYIGGQIVVIEQLSTDDTVIVNHDDINDVDQTVTVVQPKIGTVASDKISKSKILDKSENAVIVDTVSYTNLVPGTEYTLRASVYDKSSGALIEGVSATKKFTPAEANGTVSIEITLDTTNMPSSKLVVFESVYEGDTLIVDHSDENDEDQSVTVAYPGIKTLATVKGEKVAVRNENTVIEDKVAYTGLTIGKEYTLNAELRDAATGDVISSSSEAVTFVAKEVSGTVTVNISVNTADLEATDIVVYEYLTSGEETIAVHTDINDADQTVSFVDEKHPAIDTVATNKKLDSHNIAAYKQAVIVDKITYTDLEPEMTYDLKTVVYDVTNKDADRVKVAEVDSTFTTKTGSEDVSVDIELDTTTLKGHTLVVSETVLLNGKVVAAHDDMSDKDQTVYVDTPGIGTTATSVATGTHTLERSKTAQIVDRVVYSGLVPGEKYTVTATPYDKSTGKAFATVDPVTVEFVAEKSDGYVDVTITIDTTFLSGKSIVMFESLKHENVEIAVHNDINDEAQTVTVPTIDTVAVGGDGSHTLKINENVTVTDTISFTGLTVGETYHVDGRLIYKNDPAKAVSEASVEFVPTETSGTVEVQYTFNTSGHANESFVCFETVKSSGGTVLIDHKDINDADQTVTVEDTPTTTDTGDMSNMILHFTLSAIFGAAFVIYVAYMYRRRRAQ